MLLQIERVSQFGEFLVANLRHKLETADQDQTAVRQKSEEAAEETPSSVKVYGAGTLPAGWEDLRRSDLFAKGSLEECAGGEEAGEGKPAKRAEDAAADGTDQVTEDVAAKNGGQDSGEELQDEAQRAAFPEISLLSMGKEIR
eukprot:763385-Hanusia_phi.AAC.4